MSCEHASLAKAHNAENRALDALFVVAQFAPKYADAIRNVVYTCTAAWEEEQLWTGVARVQCSRDRRTHLMYAASKGDAERVRWLLARASVVAQLELTDANGWTALTWAAFKGGCAATVRILIAAGANVTVSSKSYETPLILAANAGHAEVVHELLSAGAGTTSTINGALCHGVIGGHERVVRVLLAAGASACGPNDNTTTPLEHAAKRNFVDIIHALIQAGADVNASADTAQGNGPAPPVHRRWQHTVYRSSPLVEASKRGHVPAILSLLAAGARVDDFSRGANALHSAARFARTDVIRLLCSAGADVNLTDRSSWTPLHWACAGAARLADYKDDVQYDGSALRAEVVGRNVRRGGGARAVSSQPTALTALAHELFIVSNPLNDGDPQLTQMTGDVQACADAIAALLELGADPHKVDEHGRTAVELIPARYVAQLWPLRALRPQVVDRDAENERAPPAL